MANYKKNLIIYHGAVQRLPDHMHASLVEYIERGSAVGGFLEALLSNDLKQTCIRADSDNVEIIGLYVNWLYDNAPAPCWGSAKKFAAWQAAGGLCIPREEVPG